MAGIRCGGWCWARVSGACTLLGVGLFALLSGCSSNASDSAAKPKTDCQAVCDDLCQALETCNMPHDLECPSTCARNLTALDCSRSQPASLLTCLELEQAYACGKYCSALCTRAPSCGAFDTTPCAEGCLLEKATLCNAASVPARSCDQLKPELRFYQEAASAHRAEQDFGGSLSNAAAGLCATKDDCAAPLGCSSKTNTCAPCEADAECSQAAGAAFCAANKQCTKAQCVVDAQCPKFCDTARHVCGECRSDAECAAPKQACDVASATCVSCTKDVQCNDGLNSLCDSQSHTCRACLTNADCKDPAAPRCDPDFGLCSGCKVNADCSVPGSSVCLQAVCVQCNVDAECTEATHPACNPYAHHCVECNDSTQCPMGKVCNLLTHLCN